MTTLYLCGAGNSEGVRLALSINRVAPRWGSIFLLDDDPATHGRKLLGVEVIGPFARLEKADAHASEVANLVARTTAGRRAARETLAAYGLPFASLVHPSVDTLGAELARDVTVYPNATIGPETVVGEGSVVFMGAIVGHEARVGLCCVLAANSVLNARVVLGDGVYVGTNATVLPEMRVADGATVGAGSVVVENVPPRATVMGVPARILASAEAPEPESEPSVAPVNPELERTLARIWCELLEVSEVGFEENFFDLGGHSLLALRLRERIERETGRELLPTDVFRFPTLRAQARHLGRAVGASDAGRPGANRAVLRREMRARRARAGR